ncbi:hypothetical protein [Paraflavitalea speifideaquila]|uniref:ABC transporter permease n=1 Tax=Paraflavitalea speifideaquila TaxID=3076558 RepID=UPI0028E311D0|nr:hypothetical protein [Paraflavitalea speifideiaquila]
MLDQTNRVIWTAITERPITFRIINHTMIKNYLKIAFRNLWKNKAFSSINIMGLAAGLAVCLLIVLYVKEELSYDQYNEKADRIYRIDADILFNNTQVNFAVTPNRWQQPC